MRIRLDQITVACKKSTEAIPFSDFNYFYGEIGSGKSTIARLIDYCFGGELVETPALQNEFVAASLYLQINDTPVILNRNRHSDQVRAVWGEEGKEQEIVLPARKAGGVVIPNTEVEVLSDFLNHVAGLRPTRVRRSQLNPESELERLSFRDLYWYCYLDQDEIDSDFFHLESEADHFKRLKSREVLRFIVGFHQVRVEEMERELEETRRLRTASEEAARVLRDTLAETELSSEQEIDRKRNELSQEIEAAELDISNSRDKIEFQRNHAVERLRERGRHLASELEAIENAQNEIEDALVQHNRHLHEISNLSTKIQRVAAARAVLNGVKFDKCPQCAQFLPHRDNSNCPLCGQSEPPYEATENAMKISQADLDSRIAELREVISSQEQQMRNLGKRHGHLVEAKSALDKQLNEALRQYDSAYLSATLEAERRLASLKQELANLDRLMVLPARVTQLEQKAEKLAVNEKTLHRNLKELRESAEKDTRNLQLLAELFRDCLVRARIPGFSIDDKIGLEPPWFLPEVAVRESGDLATYSFSTLGSGGKKTLFKCCFALAVHRLSAQIGGAVPTLLVIDSPMKNISERENRTQFEGFHELLYELATDELRETQFILIDKEYCPPKRPFGRSLSERHMTVEGVAYPPLIGYYRDQPPGAGDEHSAPGGNH
jgi:hypothetical protein